MPPIFSAAATQDTKDDTNFQLLEDQELLDIWENTQRALIALAAQGMRAESVILQSKQAEKELQRRLLTRPAGFIFGMKEPELFSFSPRKSSK